VRSLYQRLYGRQRFMLERMEQIHRRLSQRYKVEAYPGSVTLFRSAKFLLAQSLVRYP
jgi:hypothetical protein